MSMPVPPVAGVSPQAQTARLGQAARDFEAMAIGQLLQPMFETVDAGHAPFGGGEAEATWRPMLVGDRPAGGRPWRHRPRRPGVQRDAACT